MLCNTLLRSIVLLSVLSQPLVHAQVGQGEMASQILSDEVEVRGAAIRSVASMATDEIGEELGIAVLELLNRMNGLRAERNEAAARGEELDTTNQLDSYLAVMRIAAKLGDPQSIPTLIGAFGSGLRIPHALSRFGEDAVEPLLVVVNDPDSWHDHAQGALDTFSYMIADGVPLSPTSRDQIIDATQRRLTGVQFITTLWSAMDLAVRLNEPNLRQIVESIAADSDEVIARGIDAPDLVERTQQRAADVLGGTFSPLPQF